MPRQGLSDTFGHLVRHHRLAQKLTQEKLAEKADVHPTYVGLLERNKRVPTLDVAERVAGALGFQLSGFVREAEKLLKLKKS